MLCHCCVFVDNKYLLHCSRISEGKCKSRTTPRSRHSDGHGVWGKTRFEGTVWQSWGHIEKRLQDLAEAPQKKRKLNVKWILRICVLSFHLGNLYLLVAWNGLDPHWPRDAEGTYNVKCDHLLRSLIFFWYLFQYCWYLFDILWYLCLCRLSDAPRPCGAAGTSAFAVPPSIDCRSWPRPCSAEPSGSPCRRRSPSCRNPGLMGGDLITTSI